MTFTKRITSALAAVAVAVSGLAATATPTRALDADDVFRFLLGAATIAILIRAYTDRQQPDRRYTGRVLPDHCIETMRVGGRTIDVYNARCLRNAGLRDLPARCERTVRTDRGRRTVYSAQCLFDASYRAEGPIYVPPRATTLPARCQITYTYRGQRLAGYDGECLRRAGLRDLPQRCLLRARLVAENRMLDIYNAECMFDAGYRVDRYRRR
jgi:hypothetical protein